VVLVLGLGERTKGREGEQNATKRMAPKKQQQQSVQAMTKRQGKGMGTYHVERGRGIVNVEKG